MRARRWHLCILTVLIYACGGRQQATFETQYRAIVGNTPASKHEWVERGWWHLLADEFSLAKRAFSRSPSDDLAQLGLAHLAALKGDVAISHAHLKAISNKGFIGRIAERLKWRSQHHDATHERWHFTRTISGFKDYAMSRLKAPPELIAGQHVVIGDKKYKLFDKPPKKGLFIAVNEKPPPGQCEIRVSGTVKLWSKHGWLLKVGEPTIKRWYALEQDQAVIVATGNTGVLKLRCFPRQNSAGRPRFKRSNVGVDAPVSSWTERYLIAWTAVLRGHGDRALALLEKMPSTAAFAQLAAKALETAIERPSSHRHVRAKQLWQRALRLTPYQAHLELARAALTAAEPETAAKHLRQWRARFSPNQAFHALKIQWLELNEDKGALRRYIGEYGARCSHLDLRLRLLEYAEPDALVERFLDCGKRERAVEILLQFYRPAAALKLLREMPIATPKQRALEHRCLTALDGRDFARIQPGSSSPEQVDAAVSAFHKGELAKAQRDLLIKRWISKELDNPDAWNVATAVDEWSPYGDLRLATESRIDRHLKTKRGEASVRLLDHSVLTLDEEGRSLRRVHEIIYVGSRRDAETFSELGLPDGAIPLAIFTRKADGRRFYAEQTDKKDSLTIPNIERGDYLVASYLEPNSDRGTTDGLFLSQRVYFGDFNISIEEQRFDVVMPASLEYTLDARNGAPTARVSVRDGERHLSFRAVHTIPYVSEARGPKAESMIPSIRIAVELDWKSQVERLRDGFLSVTRPSATFSAWVDTVVDGKTGASALKALLRAVRIRFDGEHGLLDYPVSHGLFDGRGHRAAGMSAALTHLGIRHRVLLAGPSLSAEEQAFAQLHDFEHVLLQLENGQFVDPSPVRSGFGYLPFHLLGGQAIQVWPIEAPIGLVDLPTSRPFGDAREVVLKARLHTDGVVSGKIIDRFIGSESIAISAYLDTLSEQDRPRLLERVLGRAVPSGEITKLEIERPEEDDQQPLILRYRFKGRLTNPGRLGCFSMQPGRTFAGPSKRETALFLNIPIKQSVVMRIDVPDGFKVSEGTVNLTNKTRQFERVVAQDGDQIEIRCQLEMPGGYVYPDDYKAFREWAYRVDDAELIDISHLPQM